MGICGGDGGPLRCTPPFEDDVLLRCAAGALRDREALGASIRPRILRKDRS